MKQIQFVRDCELFYEQNNITTVVEYKRDQKIDVVSIEREKPRTGLEYCLINLEVGQLTNVRTSFFFELTEKVETDNTIKPVVKKKRGRPAKIKIIADTEDKTLELLNSLM